MPALSTVEGVVEGKGLPRFWDAVGPFLFSLRPHRPEGEVMVRVAKGAPYSAAAGCRYLMSPLLTITSSPLACLIKMS
jgi:hypothetical protein